MRRPKKRTVLILAALLLLLGITVVVWRVADWPPPRLILKYGFPPTGGPTGRTKVIEGIEFVELKPGYFRMGSHYLCEPGDLLGRISAVFGPKWGKPPTHDGTECPTSWVEIARPFWVARLEITNEQYELFRPGRSRSYRADRNEHPVTGVPATEAESFCSWLSKRSGVSVRLPSEMEWEFACRAGATSELSFGEGTQTLGEFGWCEGNSGVHVHVGGECKANDWGLLDMHGNVDEWCRDPVEFTWTHPGGGPSGTVDRDDGRVVRGGNYLCSAAACRSASRNFVLRTARHLTTGIRPVFTLPEDE